MNVPFDRQAIAVGQVFNPAKVDDLVEVKTSIDGKIDEDQKLRLKKLMNDGDILVTTGTKRKWSPSKGWHGNPRWTRVFKILGLIGAAGAGALSVWNILHADRHDNELHALELEMKRIQTRPYHERGGDDEKRLDMIELNRKVIAYLRNFTPEDTILDLLQVGMMYKIMGDMELSDVE